MKYEIKSAEPTYTGGGIYAMQGELTDGNYFMSDATFYWAVIVDTEPDWDDSWYPEWQDAHKVEDLCEEDTLDFIESAIRWVKANKPDGNYLMSDMDDILEDIAEEKGQVSVPSKLLASYHDDFDSAMLDAIHTLAERIADRPLDKGILESVGYEYGLIPQMEDLAKDFIKSAYGIFYESDGTTF